MKPLSRDTTPEAQRNQFELMRRLSPEKRLRLALELTDASRQMVLADLKHRFPQADEREIRNRFIARVLPCKDVIRAYGMMLLLTVAHLTPSTSILDE